MNVRAIWRPINLSIAKRKSWGGGLRDGAVEAGTRKVTERYRDKRIAITVAAMTDFESKGILRTSMTDVARRLGLTRELLYYYFEDKSEIVDAAVELYAVWISEELVEWARRWNQDEDPYAIFRSASLRDLTEVLRALSIGSNGTRAPRLRVLEEAGRREYVMMRACYIAAESAKLPDSLAVCCVVLGIQGLLLADSHIVDEEIVKALAIA